MEKNKRLSLILASIVSISILFLMGCFFLQETGLKIKGNIFIYCLQSADYDDLKQREFDIAVLDIDDCGLTTDQLKDIRSTGGTVLSYLSIGEAEDYRSYWKEGWEEGEPSFIYEENPCWEGNYKVKYWEKAWQNIITSQLDKIIDRGFDGVCLDVVDAYVFFEYLGFDNAKEDMVELVKNISAYAKEKNNEFLVIPQNAEELIDDKKYFDSIDGIGKENLFFVNGDSLDQRTIDISLYYLKKVIASNKYVFIISYSDKEQERQKVIDSSIENGFHYFIGNRELDSLDCRSEI